MAGTSPRSPALTSLRESLKSTTAATAAFHPSEIKPIEPLRKRKDAQDGRILWKTKDEVSSIAREGFGMLDDGKEHRTNK